MAISGLGTNGAKETSTQAIRIPVVIAGKPGAIHAALCRGKAPLLISRNALRALSAKIDFSAHEMRVFPEELIVPLETNSAGQYVIQLLGEAQPAGKQGPYWHQVVRRVVTDLDSK